MVCNSQPSKLLARRRWNVLFLRCRAIGEGVTKVKIEYLQKGEKSVSFAIDDICLEYETADVRVPFIEDLEISGEINSYEVDGIDPEKTIIISLKLNRET